jgi:hypothetical protein
MSTETRLACLGLSHLRDNPEELHRHLEKMLRDIKAEMDKIEESNQDDPKV